VTMVAAGGFLVYAGVRKVPLLDGLRDLSQGKLPAGTASAGAGSFLNALPSVTGIGVSAGGAASAGGLVAGGLGASAAGGSAIGPAVVAGCRKYLGTPYRFGGNDPRTGIDCSRLVQLGFAAAGVSAPRTSAGFLAWRSLRKVGTPTAGDVLWWPGHVAVAESSTRMIEAPTWGIPVRETNIRAGATVLRYIGAG
jgi:cell wall-associated NlpC family hydrolase